ncbi:hypothetical protein RI367_001652 [Sorochytrium milnesiophthora]
MAPVATASSPAQSSAREGPNSPDGMLLEQLTAAVLSKRFAEAAHLCDLALKVAPDDVLLCEYKSVLQALLSRQADQQSEEEEGEEDDEEDDEDDSASEEASSSDSHSET